MLRILQGILQGTFDVLEQSLALFADRVEVVAACHVSDGGGKELVLVKSTNKDLYVPLVAMLLSDECLESGVTDKVMSRVLQELLVRQMPFAENGDIDLGQLN